MDCLDPLIKLASEMHWDKPGLFVSTWWLAKHLGLYDKGIYDINPSLTASTARLNMRVRAHDDLFPSATTGYGPEQILLSVDDAVRLCHFIPDNKRALAITRAWHKRALASSKPVQRVQAMAAFGKVVKVKSIWAGR